MTGLRALYRGLFQGFRIAVQTYAALLAVPVTVAVAVLVAREERTSAPVWRRGRLAIVKGWVARVTTIIEFCHDCGRRQPLVWGADDDVWTAVTGRADGGGVLCPACFDRRAEAAGAHLYWVPNVEYVRGESSDIEGVTDAQ